MFDGVHLGHQHVIRQAVIDAATLGGIAVVMTFDPHPLQILAPAHAPALLQSLVQRVRSISAMGVHAVWTAPFDAALSQKPGDDFIRDIVAQLPTLRSVSVGKDFQFGRARSGNVTLLQTLGREFGFRVHALSPIAVGGITVSSTRIRETLRRGDLDHVAELLGRPYAIAGAVVQGDQRGRTLGFPTANLDITRLALPPLGVYAARTQIRGKTHLAAVNLGIRPTLHEPNPVPRCEAHLLDFDGDLYGSYLELEIVAFIRPEQAFPSLPELRAQIERDIASVRDLCSCAA